MAITDPHFPAPTSLEDCIAQFVTGSFSGNTFRVKMQNLANAGTISQPFAWELYGYV